MTEQVLGESERFREKIDVQAVPENAKGPKPSSLFFLWFGSNLTIGDFVLGFIPISLGFGVYTTVVALVIGNLLGASLLGLMSSIGPKSRVPQMVTGKRSFGSRGSTVMSLLQWVNTTGWLTINTILAAFALSLLVNGAILVYSVILITSVVALSAYFGQRFIHGFEHLMAYLLGILFVVVTYFSLAKMNFTISYAPSASFSTFTQFGVVLALSFSYIMSWGPYASDYSRYISSSTKPSRTFTYTFIGGFTASLWLEITGMLVAIGSGMASADNPFRALSPIMGNFVDLGLIGVVLGGIAANSINLYSNSLSIKAAGLKVNRVTVVVVMSALVVILSLISALNGFNYSYETFLYLLDYWITPWLGVMIADFFIVNRGGKLSEAKFRSFNFSGIISYCVALLASIPFMAPSGFPYGPIAVALNGVDLSYYVSFVLAIVLYVLLNRFGVGEWKGSGVPKI
ncbi:MAG: cytosine permease [Thermoplasmataceae archaeon]